MLDKGAFDNALGVLNRLYNNAEILFVKTSRDWEARIVEIRIFHGENERIFEHPKIPLEFFGFAGCSAASRGSRPRTRRRSALSWLTAVLEFI